MSKVRGPSAPFPLNYMYTLDTYLRMRVASYEAGVTIEGVGRKLSVNVPCACMYKTLAVFTGDHVPRPYQPQKLLQCQ